MLSLKMKNEEDKSNYYKRLNELNRQLKYRNIPLTVTERQLRPNIVVSGDKLSSWANLNYS